MLVTSVLCFALFAVVVYSLIGYITVLFDLPSCSVHVLLELVLVSELCVFLVSYI